MKTDQIYNAWKEKKAHVDISDDFTDKAMKQIYNHEQNKRKPLFDLQHLLEFVSAHPMAQAGLVASGAVAGFVRVAFMTHILLFGN